MEFAQNIAAALNIRPAQVDTVISLLNEGSTIPFIARYRKDKTGNLDEVQIMQIQDQHKVLKEFAERKAFIEKTVLDQGKLTDTLQKKLDAATSLAELEDIYLPYKPKRKTKAQTARENGLEPLSLQILQGDVDIDAAAASYVTEIVKTVDEALQGARDIIAEVVNEDAEVRAKVRRVFENEATLQSKIVAGKETEASQVQRLFRVFRTHFKSALAPHIGHFAGFPGRVFKN